MVTCVVTYGLLTWVVGSFIAIRYYKVDASFVSLSYKTVVHNREYWRVLFAWLTHDEAMHWWFNVVAIWAHRDLERYYGSFDYAKLTFLLFCLSNAIYLFIIHRLTRSSPDSSSFLQGLQNLECLGYTGVILGWTVVQANLPHFKVDPVMYLLGVLPLPVDAAPVILLVLVQVLLWNSSVLNHVSGLVSGYIVANGALDWFTEYYYVCAMQWVVVALVASRGFPPQLETEQIAEQRRAEESFRRMV